jgi:hypothetical protein
MKDTKWKFKKKTWGVEKKKVANIIKKNVIILLKNRVKIEWYSIK